METAKISFGIGELENTVLNAVWDMEQSQETKVFVSDVLEKIKTPQKKWAYTTIKTVLDRMVDKSMLLRDKSGKRFGYQSTINREEAKILALEKVLRQYFKNDVSRLDAALQLLYKSDLSGKRLGD